MMRWNASPLFLVLLLLLALPVRAGDTPNGKSRLYRIPPSQGGLHTVTETLALSPDSLRYALGHAWIDSASVSVQMGDSLLPVTFYEIAEIPGVIRFHQLPDTAGYARITYRYLPLSVPFNVQNRSEAQLLPIVMRDSVKLSEKQGRGRERTRSAQEDYSGSMNLISNGSIFRELSLSTGRGLALNSGLRLQLDGRIGDAVGVTAALTDQSVPLQPEGTTQTLEEVDKIYITLDHPNGQATFGDFTTDFQTGRFGEFRRKLEGVKFTGNYGPHRASVVGAISKGQYRSQQLRGREGSQGPYRLTGSDGSREIVVLAGTERVWLNGDLLTRGASQDYTIDYSNAEITFSPRRLITDESRIVVDFQYSDFQYNRSIYAGRFSTDLWDSKIRVDAMAASESDDRDNPLNPLINETVEDSLSTLPGTDGSLRVSTVSPDTGGAYGRVDSAGISYYTYLGEGQGNYSILFSRDPAGEYVRQTNPAGQIYYEYRPQADRVNYSPTVRVTAPKSHQIQDINLRFVPNERVSISTEIAASQRNENTYSRIGDPATGIAATSEGELTLFRWGEEHGRNGVTLYGTYQDRGGDFNPIGRAQSVEFRRNWSLSRGEPMWFSGRRRQSEVGLRVVDSRFLTGRLEWGRLTMGQGIEANRNLQEVSGRYGLIEQLSFRREEAVQEERERRELQQAELRTGFGVFHPYIRWHMEEFEGDSSVVLYQPAGGITLESGGSARTTLAYSLETIHERPDSLNSRVRKSRGRTMTWSGSWRPGSVLQTRWDVTHRQRQYASWVEGRQNSRFLLADWSGRLRGQNVPWVDLRFQWDALWEKEQVARQEHRYIRVEEGLGEYRYDSTYADYFPDPEGRYILRIVPGNEYEPVTGIQLGGEFHLEPGHNTAENSVLGTVFDNIRSSTRWRYQQKIREGAPTVIFYWDDLTRPDSAVVRQLQELRQDLHLFPGSPYYAVRYRYHKQTSLNGLDFRGAELQSREEHALRWRLAAIRPWAVETNIGVENFLRRSFFQSLRNRDVNQRFAETEVGYYPSPRHVLRTTIRWQTDKGVVAARDVQVRLFRLGEEYTFRISEKGRITAQIGWIDVRNTGDGPDLQFLPYEVAEGYQPGVTWEFDLHADYRLSEYLTLRLDYRGEDEPHRQGMYHRASGEIRAIF